MKKRIIRESIGRELVGAGNFESRSSATQKILKKFPTPQSLASALLELANKSNDPRAKQKLMELVQRCKACTPETYPQFVSKLAGLSKLWKVVGITAGATVLTAAATYLASVFIRSERNQRSLDVQKDKDLNDELARNTQWDDQQNKAVINKDFADKYGLDPNKFNQFPLKAKRHSLKDTFKGMGDVFKNDYNTIKSKADKIPEDITNWYNKQKQIRTNKKELKDVIKAFNNQKLRNQDNVNLPDTADRLMAIDDVVQKYANKK